jgi:hypothetical protein
MDTSPNLYQMEDSCGFGPISVGDDCADPHFASLLLQEESRQKEKHLYAARSIKLNLIYNLRQMRTKNRTSVLLRLIGSLEHLGTRGGREFLMEITESGRARLGVKNSRRR